MPAPVADAIAHWLGHHDHHAPGLVEGLYLIGSVALGDWRPGSDIDVVAFTAEPATNDDAAALRAAHEAYVAQSGTVVDGPYLAWGDVAVPPLAAHRPWTLDGEFHHDAECFETNPVTWFALATRGLAVRGEPAPDLGVFLDVAERRSWCRENLDTYWRGVRDQVVAALDADPDRAQFPAAMTEWCALGVARMLFTIETGDVTSKTAAGEWARDLRPDHAKVLDAAVGMRGRADATADAVVDRATAIATISWMTAAIDGA